MIINTQIILKDLKGDALKNEKNVPVTIGEVLGNVLITHKAGGKMKCFILGQKFATELGKVEVDASDFALVKEAVNTTEAYNNLVAGQVIIYLEKLVETEDKKKAKK